MPPSDVLPRPKYSGFIIVRLLDDTRGSEDTDLLVFAEQRKLAELRKVLKECGLTRTRPLVRCLLPNEIRKLEEAAAGSAYPPFHSLTSYWRIDARHIEKCSIGESVKRLNEVGEEGKVDLAYAELHVTDPQFQPDDNPLAGDQGYLEDATVGVGARWAWSQEDGTGAGVRLVVLEQGWLLDHEDINDKVPESLIYGDNRDGIDEYSGDHGTAVLGVVIGEHNKVGGIGVAHGVTSVGLVSRFQKPDEEWNVAEGIVAAIPIMDPGDVLLVEAERGDWAPTEIDDADFDAIRLASAHGIIVVETAGNKGANLDIYEHGTGQALVLKRKPLDPLDPFKSANPDFRDSGAIIVGAGENDPDHNRLYDSNYGSRVDCYAWGNQIRTCGFGDLDDGGGDPNKTYTGTFGGTSGAAAIVAGAALIVQGKYKKTGVPLSPVQMRHLLSTIGTEQGSVVPGNIGKMPNLEDLFDKLDLLPDVYVRDNIQDDGAVPSTGAISASPDIFVRPEKVANPGELFGEGSPSENSMTLGHQVQAGQDNFVYVRMKNCGTGDAVDATATVYWSKVASLVMPEDWTEIGITDPVTVPEGNTLVVAGPVEWPAAKIPGSGHYCFVAVVKHEDDPAPLLSRGEAVSGETWLDFDFDDFRAYIRNHNNVTWRNFNVIDASDAVGSTTLPLEFKGAPDEVRLFDLEIIRRLPGGAKVWLEAPPTLALTLDPERMWRWGVGRERDNVALRLPAVPRLRLRNVPLGKENRYPVKIVVRGVREMARGGHSIAVRQLYEGEELGRVTWLFHRRRRRDDEVG
jgi:hypothetical protein